MRGELGGYPAFWLLAVPIGRFPRSVAWPFFQAARVVVRLVQFYANAATAAAM
ncbi:MAG TPA: hypothetical protein VNR70_13760 [Steroidobacteraceae bacterium]|nr:hypothetical protein [Steroidobacteraceae bacterium]